MVCSVFCIALSGIVDPSWIITSFQNSRWRALGVEAQALVFSSADQFHS